MKIILIIFIVFYSCKEQNVKSNNKINTENSKNVNIASALKNNDKEDKYEFDKSFILGKFNYKKDTAFIKVNKIHSSKTLYIKKEVYQSFIKMFNKAKTENINLKIISGTRSFYEQKLIWERKWQKYKNLKPIDRAIKILEFSSMPSTSRHHWGTDIDLNNLNNSYFNKGKGKGEYNWLKLNANKFGFYQVYTNKKNGRTGYNLEKWHWSYLPLASKYLNYYTNNIKYNDINGFKGAELAKEIQVIRKYVNGISKNVEKAEIE